MKQSSQRGMLMVTVALMLAVLGALAFSMTREGAAAAQGVSAQYDTDTARYLANAAMTLALWQNEQAATCKSSNDVANTSFPGGLFSASVSGNGKKLNIVATGTTPSGATRTVTHTNVVVHDLGNVQIPTFGAGGGKTGGGSDTFVTAASPFSPQNGTQYLELTQGTSNALLQFKLDSIPQQSTIFSALLQLTEFQAVSGGTGQPVSVHRVTRAWDAPAASWLNAKGGLAFWGTPGGDYDPVGIATAITNGNATTSWDVAAFLEGYASNQFSDLGLLLRADGPMQQVHYASFESPNSNNKPLLTVKYAPPC